MRRILIMTVALLVVFAVACGGGRGIGTNPGGTPAPGTIVHKVFSSALVVGQHAYQKQTTTAINVFGIDVAYAAASVVTLSQSFNAICNLSPNTSGTIHGILYGAGQNQFPNCTNNWFTQPDPSLAAASASQGQVIIGNGTIGDLTCWATEGSVMPSGVVLHLWLMRGGQIIDTGLTCQLTGNDYQKNQNAGTFAAQDGDRAIVTYTKPETDSFVNLNAVFDKQ
jgi:hypothetical protein